MEVDGNTHQYWFQLPKYGMGYDDKVVMIPILNQNGMVIDLDQRQGESIEEEAKTVKMESQYHDFSKKHGLQISLTEKAARLAVSAHTGQTRKGDGLPYIIHPFMVALKLANHGFSDAVIAAALTHDVLEDTDYAEDEFKTELGEEVYEIVKAVTNDDSLPWEEKKKKYVETVRNGSEGAKAVAVADKIHNLESLLFAHAEQGSDIWKKFNRGKEQKLWFESEVLKMLEETWTHPLIDEYEKLFEIEKELE
jgi:(p)ppGpp synthase/HD superfamily hydrolase